MSLPVPRRVLFAIAMVAGCLAAALYYGATRRADVIVMARDMTELRALTRDDIEVRTISAELVPEDAIGGVNEALGAIPRAPLAKGQLVLAHAIGSEAADFRSGQSLVEGTRAIAFPVTAVTAVGGAVIPGARVDVIAMPIPGRAPADRPAEVLLTSALVLDVRGESGAPYTQREPRGVGASTERIASVVIAMPIPGRAPADRPAEVLLTSALVLDVRGESGAPYTQRDPRGTGVSTERIASVVLAVAFIDEVRVADRLASSTFVLALIGAR